MTNAARLQARLPSTSDNAGVAHAELGHAEACRPFVAACAAFKPAGAGQDRMSIHRRNGCTIDSQMRLG